MSYTRILLVVFLFLILILIDVRLLKSKDLNNYTTVDYYKNTDTILSGKQLANMYCKICHEFPEPELLDKDTWINSVLPNMGLRMGIKIPEVNAFAGTPTEDLDIVKMT